MAPAMDLVGDHTERVDQPVHTEFEMFQEIEQLAADAHNSTCVIFPREPSAHRSVTRQQSNGFDPAATTSPTRRTGSATSSAPASRDTCLDAWRPDADIIVLANVGVGAEFHQEIIATITDKRPIEVHAVRHPIDRPDRRR